ncbi:MAG: hypothetical protein WA733_12675 [Methylocystis sp.]
MSTTSARFMAFSQPTLGVASKLHHRLPLIIGATGHRDLRDQDILELERIVGAVFDQIASAYLRDDGATPIVVLSSLAEGADQLVARVALDHGAILVAPLPMPVDEYRRDYQPGSASDAVHEFDRLLARAVAAPVMPFVEGNTIELVRADAERRALQYREAGFFVVRHCQILLSLWDGDEGDVKTGGTAEIMRLQGEKAPLSSAESVRASIDGSELRPLITIMTPRRKSPPGSVAITLNPWGRALTSGSTRTPAAERDSNAWRMFETWIRLTTAFNAESSRIFSSNEGRAKIEQSVAELFCDPSAPGLAESARACSSADASLWRGVYAIAEILAQENQNSFTRVWRWLFILAFLMVATLGVLVDAHQSSNIYALEFYQTLVMCSIALYWFADRRQFQSRFLDYRALAEFARVAIFWRIARIDTRVSDIYPLCQPPELSWIKISLRSLECFDSGNAFAFEALDELRYRVCRNFWVDGQRKYFRRSGRIHERTATRRNHLSVALIAATVSATALLALADYFAFDWRRLVPFNGAAFVPFAIALLPALAATLKGQAEQLGRAALALQYDRMRTLYERTLAILPGSIDQIGSMTARKVLIELGREAMHETASWLSIFRQHPLRPF